MKYVTVDKDGYVTGGGECHDDAAEYLIPLEGMSIVCGIDPPSNLTRKWKLVDGALVDSGPFVVLSYADERRFAYPPIADFADAWVKQDEAALEEYRQKCLAVKAKYPKPGSN